MALRFMGKKRGMTQLFDESGNAIVCTVIEAEPNVVTQIKTKESDGYNAVQLGFEKIVTKDPRTAERRAKKPMFGHFKKAGVDPRRYVTESRLEQLETFSLGQEVGVGQFAEVKYIDVMAISKGKGYQGVIKRHNFAGGPASHGSGFHRHAGSTGMRTTPGRCLPGGKKPGHMGDQRKTIQNLEIVRIDEEDNLIIVKGAVPGPKNGLVVVSQAIKLSHTKKKGHK